MVRQSRRASGDTGNGRIGLVVQLFDLVSKLGLDGGRVCCRGLVGVQAGKGGVFAVSFVAGIGTSLQTLFEIHQGFFHELGGGVMAQTQARCA